MTIPDPYRRAFDQHGYTPDRSQLAAIRLLDELCALLRRAARRERRWLWRLRATLGRVPARRPVPGIYLWGGVGRGKTLLLDIFYSSLEVPARRAHFHRFMQEVHARLKQLRPEGVEDPLARVARDLAADVRVLCFDELHVGDIADAMLLGGLFEGLIGHGVTLVFTSNVPPAGLYRDGLQRGRFLPAIALLERNLGVVEVEAGTDYRLRELERAPLYVPSGADDSEARLRERFDAVAGMMSTPTAAIEIEGRPISVRRLGAGVAWFDFAAVCGGPRGTADYIEIARQYHSVIVSAVPVFDASADDAARRFVALVDEFYERGVKLIVSAAAPPESLYHGERLSFEFRRTASRLAEMQSHDYLARPHRP